MKYELLISDRYYHIYNRGNNKEDIFLELRNYDYFLLLLIKHVVPIAEIYAYCLLKNHFHLLIKTKNIEDEKLISKGLSNLFNAYAKAINKAYNRTGSLFQDRFSRIMIEDENYLKRLVLYIHLNPKHHKFVEDFSSYEYSSFQKIVSKNPTFLERETVLDLFEDKENFIYVHNSRQNEIIEQNDEFYLE
ncbi:MAG: transposase [Gillisia sp.]|nr:transposase [Gillisia sp.]